MRTLLFRRKETWMKKAVRRLTVFVDCRTDGLRRSSVDRKVDVKIASETGGMNDAYSSRKTLCGLGRQPLLPSVVGALDVICAWLVSRSSILDRKGFRGRIEMSVR